MSYQAKLEFHNWLVVPVSRKIDHRSRSQYATSYRCKRIETRNINLNYIAAQEQILYNFFS